MTNFLWNFPVALGTVLGANQISKSAIKKKCSVQIFQKSKLNIAFQNMHKNYPIFS